MQQDQARQERFINENMEIEAKEDCFLSTKSKFFNENQYNQNISNSLDKSPSEIKRQVSTISKKEDNSKANKKQVKRSKIFIDKFQEFIPQLLLQINHGRPKTIIRIGSNYQAKVSRQPIFKSKYRDISHLLVWNGSNAQKDEGNPQSNRFDVQVLEKFKKMFGQNRTEEQLCHLKLQFQSTWDNLIEQIAKRKQQLKKYYTQKDKGKS